MNERRKRSPNGTADISTRQALPDLPPARTEEEEEKRAIGLANELAIKQLREGTASSQIITHFLKLGSQKEQAELEKVRREIELLEAKKKAIESDADADRRYQELMDAIRSYSGKDDEWEIVEDDG